MNDPERYTLDLISTTVDATNIKATLTDTMGVAIVLSLVLIIIFIINLSLLDDNEPKEYPVPKTSALSAALRTIAVASFPIIGLYSFIADANPYGYVPGYSITTTPSPDSEDGQEQTLATLLHEDIEKELAKNQDALNEYGLGDRCDMMNELTNNNAESILCGGTQLESVETDKAKFYPDIKVNGRPTDPHNVSVTATVTTELK